MTWFQVIPAVLTFKSCWRNPGRLIRRAGGGGGGAWRWRIKTKEKKGKCNKKIVTYIFSINQSIRITPTERTCWWAPPPRWESAVKRTLFFRIWARLNLLRTATGGDVLASDRRWRQRQLQDDAGLWFSTISMNPAFYLPSGAWTLISTSVWVNGKDRLPLCNFPSTLLGLPPWRTLE